MKNMRNFTINFLLFALFPTALFGMEQTAVYPIAATFHPTKNQIALLCSNQVMKIWDTTNNHIYDVKDTSLDTVKAEFAIKKCEPNILIHNSIKIFCKQRIILGSRKNIAFTNGAFSENILSCALNAHNEDNPTVALGFKNATKLYNKLNTWEASDTLPHKDGIYSTALAFNRHGTILVSCTNDGKATLYLWKDNKLKPFYNGVINLNPLTKKIINPTIYIVIKEILLNPLCALKALCRNTSFTTKTIATLAGLSALWLCYTKYVTSRK